MVVGSDRVVFVFSCRVAIRFSDAAARSAKFVPLRSHRIVSLSSVVNPCAELKDGKREALRQGFAKDKLQGRTGGIVCAVRRSFIL